MVFDGGPGLLKRRIARVAAEVEARELKAKQKGLRDWEALDNFAHLNPAVEQGDAHSTQFGMSQKETGGDFTRRTDGDL